TITRMHLSVEKERDLLKNSLMHRNNISRRFVEAIYHFLSKYQHKESHIVDEMICRLSGYFDENWYLSEYPDVANSGIDPLKHFVKYGAFEKRNPGPEFNTHLYLDSHPELHQLGLNPLVHYLRFGDDFQE